MKRSDAVAANIDDCITGFPPVIRARLATMRATIRQHVPDAEERIIW